MKKLLTFIIAAVISLTSAFTGPAAQADESSKVLQILESVAPGVLGEHAVARKEVDISNRLKVAKTGGVGFESKDLNGNKGIHVTVDYASDLLRAGGGLAVLRGSSANVSAVLEENNNGFRVITTLSAEPDENRFEYSFDVPKDTKLEETPYNYLMHSEGKILGSIARPWALDANGQALETHYEWKNGVLTQVLDAQLQNLKYPVVMDPAWGYIQQYDLNYSPNTNFLRLQTCFNCYFPVAGAPKYYPSYGQLLPLNVLGLGNFECRMGSTYTATNYRAFQFNATRNHIDGEGSNIIFQLTKIGTKNVLVVEAYIVNDFFLIGQGFYVAMAGAQWQVFANNLNSTTPRT
ncbi:MAG: hypothetical protein RL174_932 [Actinomycetota bacterium]|jgi:hypothetical protein